jgi:outer membrane receptor protein involved in Fe transport
MTGSLSEADYNGGNYESDQTFTERNAFAFRFKSTLDKSWNTSNKTTLNLAFRKNDMGQNPSYRVRQFRNMGQLTGFGSGELNKNTFYSYVALLQHKKDFSFKNASLIVGATTDVSPQKYIAETLDVFVDTETSQNVDFNLNSGDYILNYKANILNYAAYAQFEINPIDKLKLTAALRYDVFEYDYDNQVDGIAGADDSIDTYNNVSPKIGANFNLNKKVGFYANYSNGFTPPQTATLYRNRYELLNIKPSVYNNFEIGTYAKITKNFSADIALYLLNGKNTLITLRDENDAFYNTNAGKTRSFGIEYGLNYKPLNQLTVTHNGTFSKHEYVTFSSGGIDYSNSDRETAPQLIGTTKLIYKPNFANGLALTLSHELVGKYNTSFEGQAEDNNNNPTTSTYKGHNIFNALVSYKFKSFDVWVHALNLFDDLYAARASYNSFRGENSYTIGNPRAFHIGVKYNF